MMTQNIPQKINEWLIDVDIKGLRNHIIKTSDLIAAEAEQFYYKILDQVNKVGGNIIGFEFFRDKNKAEITVFMTGDYFKNDKALRTAYFNFGHDWILTGGSTRLTKPNIPSTWHFRKSF